MRKITLEEHFVTPALLKHVEELKRDGLYFTNIKKGEFGPDGMPERDNSYPGPVAPELEKKVPGYMEDFRLQQMDAYGIDMQVLSLTAPGVQQMKDTQAAIKTAKETNDFLAEVVKRHPTRFAGFATLPTQEPKVAADELERSVMKLGFKGAMINSHTRGEFLDQKRFWVIFERAEALGVPLYIHPTFLTPQQAKVFEEYPQLYDAAWGFSVETSYHALRIILSGVLDVFPKTTLILGHMGELMMYHLGRIDNRIQHGTVERKMKNLPSEYVKKNFMVTTSGTFSHEALHYAISVLGSDRVMFAIDYPYELIEEAVRFIDTAPISDAVKEQICHLNAERLLRL